MKFPLCPLRPLWWWIVSPMPHASANCI